MTRTAKCWNPQLYKKIGFSKVYVLHTTTASASNIYISFCLCVKNSKHLIILPAV